MGRGTHHEATEAVDVPDLHHAVLIASSNGTAVRTGGQGGHAGHWPVDQPVAMQGGQPVVAALLATPLST